VNFRVFPKKSEIISYTTFKIAVYTHRFFTHKPELNSKNSIPKTQFKKTNPKKNMRAVLFAIALTSVLARPQLDSSESSGEDSFDIVDSDVASNNYENYDSNDVSDAKVDENEVSSESVEASENSEVDAVEKTDSEEKVEESAGEEVSTEEADAGLNLGMLANIGKDIKGKDKGKGKGKKGKNEDETVEVKTTEVSEVTVLDDGESLEDGSENSENAENLENAENSENSENPENSENTENSEDTDESIPTTVATNQTTTTDAEFDEDSAGYEVLTKGPKVGSSANGCAVSVVLVLVTACFL